MRTRALSNGTPRRLPAGGAGAGAAPTVRRVALPDGVRAACSCLFTRDGRLLILGSHDGVLQTLTLDDDDDDRVSLHTFRGPPSSGSATGAARGALTRLAITDDGQWVATVDSRRNVHVHSVDGLCFSSAAPPTKSPPTALAFLPSSPVLVVATASKAICSMTRSGARPPSGRSATRSR